MKLNYLVDRNGKHKPAKIYKGFVDLKRYEFVVEAINQDDATLKIWEEAREFLEVDKLVCIQEEDDKETYRVIWDYE